MIVVNFTKTICYFSNLIPHFQKLGMRLNYFYNLLQSPNLSPLIQKGTYNENLLVPDKKLFDVIMVGILQILVT